MTVDLAGLVRMPAPTARFPLRGVTLLVVEDSRAASEAVRLMALRSGARVRRAASLRAARRHLLTYRPRAVIVDLGLPDGPGAELVAELAAARPRVDAILATSGEPEARHTARAAGADGFLAKPLAGLAVFQQAVLATLRADAQPSGPRALSAEELPFDPIAFQEDIARAAHLLEAAPDRPALAYVAQFVGSVARDAEDGELAAAAGDLSRHLATEMPAAPGTEPLRAVISARLAASSAA